jgi:hypothetical protein
MKTTLKEQIDNKKNLIIKRKTKKGPGLTLFFLKKTKGLLFFILFSVLILSFFIFLQITKYAFTPPPPRGSLKKKYSR